MFDLRYHVVSLAAVFLALVIGILLGVGISGRAPSTSSSATATSSGSPSSRASSRRQGGGRVQRAGSGARRSSSSLGAYPALMENRLAGRRVARPLRRLGEARAPDGRADASRDADAGGAPHLRASSVPLDAEAIDARSAAIQSSPAIAGADRLRRARSARSRASSRRRRHAALGRSLARSSSSRSSGLERARAATAIVVARHGRAAAGGDRPRLLAGFYECLASGGSRWSASRPPRRRRLGACALPPPGTRERRRVDTRARPARARLLLAGATRGHYGVKDTAERILPRDRAGRARHLGAGG